MSKLRLFSTCLVAGIVSFLLIAPTAIVTPRVLDVGDVYGNQAITATFRVFNLGLRPIHVDSYKGSCTCSTFYGPDVIWPLHSYKLSVVIRSRGVSGGYKVELAMLLHNAHSQIFEIYGNRIISCTTEPTVVNLSAFDKVDDQTLSQDLLFQFGEPIPAESIKFTTKDDRLQVIPVTKLVGNVTQVRARLTYNYVGIRGEFSNSVNIHYFMEHNSEYGVDVHGRLPGGLEIEPAQVDLNQSNIFSQGKYEMNIEGLEAGEKISEVKFSGNVPKNAISWTIDSSNHLNLIFERPDLAKLLRSFSILALTAKGQTATVYFSK